MALSVDSLKFGAGIREEKREEGDSSVEKGISNESHIPQ